jgi:hypothetical protein
MASFGPGLGTGFSIIPTAPISFITKAFIAAPLCEALQKCEDPALLSGPGLDASLPPRQRESRPR